MRVHELIDLSVESPGKARFEMMRIRRMGENNFLYKIRLYAISKLDKNRGFLYFFVIFLFFLFLPNLIFAQDNNKRDDYYSRHKGTLTSEFPECGKRVLTVQILNTYPDDYPYDWYGGLKPFTAYGKWGFYDTAWNEAIPPIYDKIIETAYPIEFTLIQAKLKNKWGIIDIKGTTVIPFIYDTLSYIYGNITNPGLGRVFAKANGKWGLINLMDETISPFKYDSIAGAGDNCGNFYKFSLGGKFGFLSVETGLEAFPPIFDALWCSYNGRIKVMLGKKVGLMDRNLKILIPIKYDEIVYDMDLQNAKVKLNGKWGRVDAGGAEIIPIKYDEVDKWVNKKVKVKLNGKYGVVDSKGKELIPIIYDDIPEYSGGLFTKVKIKGKFGMVDSMGQEIIPPIYDYLSGSHPPIAGEINGKWAYINKNGKQVTPVRYDRLSFEWNAIIPVEINNKWAFINSRGKEVSAFIYDDVKMHNEGSYIVKANGKYGFFDSTNNTIIPLIYDNIHLCQDLLIFNKKGRWGFMLLKSKISVKPKYQEAMCFGTELAVQINGMWGFIDKMGKIIIRPKYKYDEIRPFREGLAAVKKKGKWGYINKDGKIIIPLRYDETTGYFSDGQTGVRIGNMWGVIGKNGKIIVQIDNDSDPIQDGEFQDDE